MTSCGHEMASKRPNSMETGLLKKDDFPYNILETAVKTV
jgi:hypothetical protein